MRGHARLSIYLHDVASPGFCLLVYLRLLCLLLDGHHVTVGFLSYSRHDVPTLVCYKRAHPEAKHGSSTGFDSSVVPVELPSCSPKQLRTLRYDQY
ncbi:hypothetical protein EI94DRAFT_1718943 [Lactarius quietus]|nr:hypothetical protein EI94DRAFT_1718943 [Lactarius quietus]